ncbi:hypothetical protein CDO43_08520, partial [Pseudomonas aeruginosa]
PTHGRAAHAIPPPAHGLPSPPHRQGPGALLPPSAADAGGGGEIACPRCGGRLPPMRAFASLSHQDETPEAWSYVTC